MCMCNIYIYMYIYIYIYIYLVYTLLCVVPRVHRDEGLLQDLLFNVCIYIYIYVFIHICLSTRSNVRSCRKSIEVSIRGG